MHLWILRHGEALRPPHVDDADRPLSDVGMRQANAAAVAISKLEVLEEIWTSPLLRARQTSDAFARACTGVPVRVVEELAPGTRPRTIVDLLRTSQTKSVLLVTHEPLSSDLTSFLAAGDGSLHVEFTPCTLALLAFGRDIRKGGGIIRAFLPPEAILHQRITHRS
ncbi:MAG: hypothetical protein A2X67_05165 [Ignavibacteria bacterium GWA2_55_11]|nr:MAG: hypothetical protein A2X67_05165 [Ignavibacteria bacterium GWA2_55_11]OGU46720.1 MAG: hypothetical protein A2X68_04160 [Ignavibacteria bacterium GWC2_56_12]OGU64716.1 MAG: hypothetical protein A3C56_04395 [Ignavibacteria bacterium RIFCSPHIGHO2_02_FULL_56_12]OGU70853.1 MAG: hypothetical protein A3G43_02655 [Ignavibacteria bacterium RIFCSPLOWO2_12_FULL_56_21]OGU73306.1 MAG: hypothetical protein A3H45_14275 [Ignavibacteria bacterium RIFCSPLOWO2_02_FULL_55_14]HAV24421.1 hypothetical protei